MAKKKTYEEESEKLIKAIDIAIDSFHKYLPKDWEMNHLVHTVDCYKNWKEQVINSTSKSLTSLKYHINDVFTYFNEVTGQTVEYFWQRINEEGLDYTRTNKLEKILKQGKIRGRIEYDYVTDMIVVAEQTGMTTAAQSEKLGKMLSDYELRSNK